MLLESINLEERLQKKEYNKQIDNMGLALGRAQRMAREAGKPVIIIFEGWNGSRRENVLTEILQYMDSRNLNVYSTAKLNDEQITGPFFSYFWDNLPAKGHIAVYHQSWYYYKNVLPYVCAAKQWSNPHTHITYQDINAFEKTLTDDNYLILKFFLHISPKKQKDNIEKYERKFGRLWKKSYQTMDDVDNYQLWQKKYDDMLVSTNAANAPWHIIPADDIDYAKQQIVSIIIDKLEVFATSEPVIPAVIRPQNKYDVLGNINPDQEMSKSDYKELLDKYSKRLAKLQIIMYNEDISTVIGLEGWDAGGKGGAIRRLTEALNPLGYAVHPVAAPNIVERQFNHLWRFWTNLPATGEISIFDRTWYGRVMVERLEGFARIDEWERAYAEINAMEKQWTDHGVALAKFWLQIDKDEQLKRFTERQNDVNKQWKITDEDWRNREKWEQYEEAVNEMIARTSTPNAPWTIVEANNKYYARLKVLKTIIDLWESKLKAKGVEI